MSIPDTNLNTDTSIVNPPPEYSLKYDEKTEGLRDKTYPELKKESNEKMIKCPCSNKTYPLSPQWTRGHFATQKHESWKTLIQEEYIKKYGHCCSSEHIIDICHKDLRDLKRNVKYLTDDKKMLLNMVEKLTNEVSTLKLEEQKMSVKYSILLDNYAKLVNENEMLKCVEVENEQFMDCNLEMP
jgi:hypothetical protein